MILKEINDEHTKLILTELCNRVGCNYDGFDFSEPQWYWKYTWTSEQEEDFRLWLAKFLTKNKYTKKGKYRGQDHGYYEAGKFLMNYGWKTKEK